VNREVFPCLIVMQ